VGGASRTHATRRQRILPASAVRELGKSQALLLGNRQQTSAAEPAALVHRPARHPGHRRRGDRHPTDHPTGPRRQHRYCSRPAGRAMTADDEGLTELDRQFAGSAADSHALLQHAPPPAAGDEQAFLPCFDSLEAWVADVFAATYARRSTPTFRWCAQWWRHPEAIARLEVLWRSWEALRTDPLLGIASWHSSHLDQQLPILTGAAGPFADCDPTRHFDANSPTCPSSPPPPAGGHPPPHLRPHPDLSAGPAGPPPTVPEDPMDELHTQHEDVTGDASRHALSYLTAALAAAQKAADWRTARTTRRTDTATATADQDGTGQRAPGTTEPTPGDTRSGAPVPDALAAANLGTPDAVAHHPGLSANPQDPPGSLRPPGGCGAARADQPGRPGRPGLAGAGCGLGAGPPGRDRPRTAAASASAR